ncbi:Protein of unknown function [Weissella confusa LBAE C39-2]|nr:Protein of unknown function [Weissella confusa LBAE C39-2]
MDDRSSPQKADQ